MAPRSTVVLLGLGLAASISVANADQGRIADVVAALNARAVAPLDGEIGDDGTPFKLDCAAAWTVFTPLGDNGACTVDVAVLGAAVAAQVNDVVTNLTGDARISSVTGIVITAVTPTVVELEAFDAVLVFTNSTPQDNVQLGTNLADYVDGGGGVVLTIFGIRASVDARTIGGRFQADNYYCVERSVGATTTGSATLGTVHVPGSAIMDNVTTFNGGTSGFRSPAPLNANATRIADWSTGEILVAERTDLVGGRVDLNFFAVSETASAGSWLLSTDGEILLRNGVVQAGCAEPPPPFGACCFNDGSCIENQSSGDCATAGGTYRGDGTDCSPNQCPQPGACCANDGTCQVVLQSQCGGTFLGGGTSCGVGACLGSCCLANDTCVIVSIDDCAAQSGEFRGIGTDCTLSCRVTEEVEPNDNKAQATPVGQPLEDGDCMTGTTTGLSTITPGPASADTFLITMASRPLGIYRHRLEYSSDTPFNLSTIRGLNQSAGVVGTTDSTAQSASATTSPPRFVQWYGFGQSEQLYFRVTGTTTTTAEYQYCLTTQSEAPLDLGNFVPGQITVTTIGQGHSTDTDLWMYDSNLDAITDYGNDDESIAGGGTGTTTQSLLTRNYGPGRYFLALTNFNFENNLPSPADDDDRASIVLDFPDLAVNSNITTNLNVTFTITDAAGSTQVPATKTDPYQILWFTFNVLTPPPFGACCMNDGSCVENQSAADCATAGGTYLGDGSDCSPNNCPQPGACCANDGSCQTILESLCNGQSGTFLGEGTNCGSVSCLGACCLLDQTCVIVSANGCAAQSGEFRGPNTGCAACQETNEVEPNETKAQATPVFQPMGDSACIIGNSTGASTTIPGPASADTWLIEVSDRPLGIYRHRLEYASDTPFHGSTIRGLNQTDPDAVSGGLIGTVDSIAQTASTTSTPPRFVQWYGFGHGENLYFRVTGTTTTTADYRYCLSTEAVTPTDIGQFAPGQIVITTIGQGHTTDTDLWVYDGGLNAISGYGCDDESIAAGGTGTTLQSLLPRNYAVGQYYLAISNYNTANNQASPEDDDFEIGIVLDFPDLAMNSATTTNVNVTFTISDSLGASQQVAATKPGPFDIVWFRFQVGSPCPGARGDANCDGAVNFFDIDPFLQALFDPSGYAAAFCGGSICAVDINCDGLVNFFDIDPFIACVFTGCAPCP